MKNGITVKQSKPINLTINSNSKKKSVLVRYSDEPKDKLDHLRLLVDRDCCNLYPSIICLWYNHNQEAKYSLINKLVVGKTCLPNNEGFWTASSRKAFSPSQISRIAGLIHSQESNCKYVRYLTANCVSKLQDNLLFSHLISNDEETFSEYFYDLEEQVSCTGKKFEDLRRYVKKFRSFYDKDIQIKIYDSINNKNIDYPRVKQLFDDWVHFGTDGASDHEEETKALNAFINPANQKYFGDVVVVLLEHRGRLVGFVANEIIDEKYAINHFHKANLNMTGISYYLFHINATLLRQRGVKYLDFQEDCGIVGLKAFKQKMRPNKISSLYKIDISSF